jgi:hypothetical protein
MKTGFNKQDFIDWLNNEHDYYEDKADDDEESFEERKFAKNVQHGINKTLVLVRKGVLK